MSEISTTRPRIEGLAMIARLSTWLSAARALLAAVASRRRRTPATPDAPADVRIIRKNAPHALYRELTDDEWGRPPRGRRAPDWAEDQRAAKARLRW